MAVFKMQNGKWACKFRYTDWRGARRQKKREGFETKKAALDFENDFLNNCSTNCDILFKNLVEKYLDDCAVRLKPTTLATKQHIIETKLLPYFGMMPINTITVATVRQWQNALIGDEKNYAPTYLKLAHNQLSAIFNYAKKYYCLPSNPAAECGAMGKKKADRLDFWTKAEFDMFLDAVSDKPLSRVVFTLLFYSGLREGELLALTLKDFDFSANTISVNKTYARLHGADIVQPPKTPKSVRTVIMPAHVMKLVSDYASTIYDLRPTDRLFAVTKHYLSKELARGAMQAGVKRIRVHDLRHSHASLLIEMNFSPLLISERLGHENIETTLGTYSHLYPHKQQEVAEKLQKLIDP
jgi:integrase